MRVFALAVAATLACAASAHAEDLMLDPTVATPAQDWTGFYAGVIGGYGWGSVNYVVTGTTTNVPISGFLAGGTAGYNYQWNHFVLGAEADLAWNGIGGSKAVVGGTLSSNIGWQATLRGRAGVTFDQVPALFYATAGLAGGGVRTSINVAGSKPYDATQIGWTAGVGVEGKVMDQLSLKLEYAYSDLGTVTIPAGALITGFPSGTSHVTAQTVKLGANWHF